MSRTCAALSLGVLPAPPACFITPPQSRCSGGTCAAPQPASSRWFRWYVCGASQSFKPVVLVERVRRLTELQADSSGGTWPSASLLPNRKYSTSQQRSRSRWSAPSCRDRCSGPRGPFAAATASLPRRGRRHDFTKWCPTSYDSHSWSSLAAFPRDGSAARGASALP